MLGLGAAATIAVACIATRHFSKAAQETKKTAQTVVKAAQEKAPDYSSHTQIPECKRTTHFDTIPAYQNKEVISRIKAVSGTIEEKAGKIKDIFMEELGYDPKLINLSINDDLPQQFMGGLNYFTGEFSLSKKFINLLPAQEITPLIRHELDHFDKAAKLCKSIGIDEYEKIFANIDERALIDTKGQKFVFNRDFWQAASEKADIKGFDLPKYKQALIDYLNRGDNPEPTIFGNYNNLIKYVSNPLEESAYDIQHSVEKALPIRGLQTVEYFRPLFADVDKEIGALLKRTPLLQNNKAAVFDYLYGKALGEEFPDSAVLISKLQQLLTRECDKSTLLCEVRVFKRMVELAKADFNHEDIVGAFNNRQVTLMTALTTRKADEAMANSKPVQQIIDDAKSLAFFNQNKEEAKKRLLNQVDEDRLRMLFGKNTDDFIKYLEQSKTADDNILNLYLTKLICENNITSASTLEDVAKIPLSDEIKNKIFNNVKVKAGLASLNREVTEKDKLKVLWGMINGTAASLGL